MSGTIWDEWLELEEEEEKPLDTKTFWPLTKRLVAFGWPYRWQMLLLLVFIISDSIFSVLQPLIFAEAVDGGIAIYFNNNQNNVEDEQAPADFQTFLWTLGGKILLGTLLQNVVSLIHETLQQRIYQGLCSSHPLFCS